MRIFAVPYAAPQARLAAAAGLALALAATLTAPTGASAATSGQPTVSPSAERALAAALGRERADRHLPALAPARDLTRIARRWARLMAAAHEVAQDPALADEAGDWRSLGENVGMGPDPASVAAAFLTSRTHRANIYATDYTEVGIGAVVATDGTLFVVEDFRLPVNSVPAPPAPRPSATPRSTTRAPAPSAQPSRPAPAPTSAATAATTPSPRPGLADTGRRPDRQSRAVRLSHRHARRRPSSRVGRPITGIRPAR